MRSINISIAHNNNLTITNTIFIISYFHRFYIYIKTKSLNHRHNLSIFLYLIKRCFMCIQNFASHRHNSLKLIISCLFKVAAGAITFCDNNFTLFTVFTITICQFTIKFKSFFFFLLAFSNSISGFLRGKTSFSRRQCLIGNHLNFFLICHEPNAQIFCYRGCKWRHFKFSNSCLHLSIICDIWCRYIKYNIKTFLNIITRKIFIFIF